MDARAVEAAATHLRELRHEEWGDFGLAALALAFAVGATAVQPSLAVPSFVGGIFLCGRGIRALWRRWDLTDRLVGERDAYVIPEVRARALRAATSERRQTCAAVLRAMSSEPPPLLAARVEAAAADLAALVERLDDEQLELEPVCAVQCMRLLSDPNGSPLLDPAVPPEELRSRIRQICAGFRPRTTG